jgi:hypothetical protein
MNLTHSIQKTSFLASMILVSIFVCTNPGLAKAPKINANLISGEWSFHGGEAYPGKFYLARNGTFTFKGFKSINFKSKGVWTFNSKSQTITLKFTSDNNFWKLYTKESGGVFSIINDTEIDKVDGNKCRFMIVFDKWYFEKTVC